MKIPKQEYTAEFNKLAVKRVKAGQTAGVVAREQMELSRVRAENFWLRRKNDILKKAAAYFAKDIT